MSKEGNEGGPCGLKSGVKILNQFNPLFAFVAADRVENALAPRNGQTLSAVQVNRPLMG